MSKYYLAVSPVDDSLYVSDSDRRRVVRLTAADSIDVVAGTGRPCLSADQHHCGDGQLAVDAALSHPKGASSYVFHPHHATTTTTDDGMRPNVMVARS